MHANKYKKMTASILATHSAIQLCRWYNKLHITASVMGQHCAHECEKKLNESLFTMAGSTRISHCECYQLWPLFRLIVHDGTPRCQMRKKQCPALSEQTASSDGLINRAALARQLISTQAHRKQADTDKMAHGTGAIELFNTTQQSKQFVLALSLSLPSPPHSSTNLDALRDALSNRKHTRVLTFYPQNSIHVNVSARIGKHINRILSFRLLFSVWLHKNVSGSVCACV